MSSFWDTKSNSFHLPYWKCWLLVPLSWKICVLSPSFQSCLDEMILKFNVFGPSMKYWILHQLNGTLITMHCRCFGLLFIQFFRYSLKPHNLCTCIACGYILCKGHPFNDCNFLFYGMLPCFIPYCFFKTRWINVTLQNTK